MKLHALYAIVLISQGILGSWVRGRDDDDDEGFCEPTRELTIDDLHCNVNTEDGRLSIRLDFHKVKRCLRKAFEAAETGENCGKNRYKYVLPYDATRVRLLDGDSDYINANYVDGFEKKKEYIATQAPLEHTVGDFWRMIWQEGTSKIVTLANIIEEGKEKMFKYWPDSNQTLGGINVSPVSEIAEPRCDCTIRTYLISKDGKSREVKQFHYTEWPDESIPIHADRFIEYVNTIREYKPEDDAPIVVHCSAGVGRTGTYIMIDSIWRNAKMARDDDNIDFLERLRQMRQFRFYLVSTEDQYLFAHDAVHKLLHPDESRVHTNCPQYYGCRPEPKTNLI